MQYLQIAVAKYIHNNIISLLLYNIGQRNISCKEKEKIANFIEKKDAKRGKGVIDQL